MQKWKIIVVSGVDIVCLHASLLGGLNTGNWDCCSRNRSPAFIVLNDEDKFEIWNENEEKTEIDFNVGETYHVMLQQYAVDWIGNDTDDSGDDNSDCNHNTWFCKRTENYRFVVYVDCELEYETTLNPVIAYDPVYLHIFQQSGWWWEDFKSSAGTVEDFLIGTTIKTFLIFHKKLHLA